MKKILGPGLIAVVLAGLGLASRRLASHQAVPPGLAGRVNTRVTRINQH